MLSSFLNILFRYHLSYQNLIVSDNISFSFVVHFLKFFFSSKLPCTISFSSCIFLTVFCFFFHYHKGYCAFSFFLCCLLFKNVLFYYHRCYHAFLFFFCCPLSNFLFLLSASFQLLLQLKQIDMVFHTFSVILWT